MERRIREWTLHEEIGRGGMGVVYRATHEMLTGEWAIKVIKPELAEDDEARTRFISEVNILKRLHHPHLVEVETPFMEDGRLHLPMELLTGESLDAKLKSRPGPWDVVEAVRVVREASEGVGFAHTRNPAVLHRDLKPANFQVLDDGHVKILDFGLARTLGEKSMTATGKAVGTPAYMAPEVFDGQKASPRSDVYALGLILYRLLAGRLPYDMPDEDSSIQAVFAAVFRGIERGLPNVREFAPDTPPDLAALVMRSLSRDPVGRPADGAELAALLGRVEEGAVSGGLRPAGANENSPVPGPSPARTVHRKPGAIGPATAAPGPDPDATFLGIDLDKAASQSGISRGDRTVPSIDESDDPDRSRLDISVPGADARTPATTIAPMSDKQGSGRGSKARKLLIPAIIVAVSAAVLAGWYLGHQLPSQSAATPNSEIQWVRIPGGTFRMGSDEGGDDEKPVHSVKVSTFEMAKTETTVAQYRKCVEVLSCSEPDTGVHCNWGRSDRDDYPINCIDWNQATAFARFVGGRLPTEAEWEYAARNGGRDQKYPWGDQTATCEYALMNDGSGTGCGRDTMWPVCSKPAGNTAQGLCDMAGSVWEWISDWKGDYGIGWVTNPTGPLTGSFRVNRGGSWGNDARSVRSANRASRDVGHRSHYLGLRPVRSVFIPLVIDLDFP